MALAYLIDVSEVDPAYVAVADEAIAYGALLLGADGIPPPGGVHWFTYEKRDGAEVTEMPDPDAHGKVSDDSGVVTMYLENGPGFGAVQFFVAHEVAHCHQYAVARADFPPGAQLDDDSLPRARWEAEADDFAIQFVLSRPERPSSLTP
jgi:hypothetical protein